SYYILALGLSTSSSSCIFFFFFYCSAAHRYSHSFPTRRSSEAFVWWKETYGDDFYVELNRHGIPEEDGVNETLLKFAEKHNVKYFASNNTYYIDKSDAKTPDLLLCVRDAESVNKPKKYIGKRGREYRYGLPSDEFYFKSSDEMIKLFADLTES